MLILEPNQIKSIESKIALAGIENNSLNIDLTDHICCMIEERVEMGMDLLRAEEEVFKEMGEVQLKSIEIETKRLTQNKFIMKKRTKIIGLVALFLMLTGFTMKMYHLAGAGVTWGVGVLTAVFGFALFLTVDKFSYEKTSTAKVLSIIGFLGSGSFILGSGFKLLRQPGSHYMIAIGGVLLLIYYILNNAINSQDKLS